MILLTRPIALLENAKTENSTPFQIREIKHPQDGQNLSFKCVFTTSDGPVKKIQVTVFFPGKGKYSREASNNLRISQQIYLRQLGFVCWASAAARTNWPAGLVTVSVMIVYHINVDSVTITIKTL
jgi:hypothetical protein